MEAEAKEWTPTRDGYSVTVVVENGMRRHTVMTDRGFKITSKWVFTLPAAELMAVRNAIRHRREMHKLDMDRSVALPSSPGESHD